MMNFISVSFSDVHGLPVLNVLTDGGRLHNIRRKSVSIVDKFLGKEISSDVDMR